MGQWGDGFQIGRHVIGHIHPDRRPAGRLGSFLALACWRPVLRRQDCAIAHTPYLRQGQHRPRRGNEGRVRGWQEHRTLSLVAGRVDTTSTTLAAARFHAVRHDPGRADPVGVDSFSCRNRQAKAGDTPTCAKESRLTHRPAAASAATGLWYHGRPSRRSSPTAR